MLRLLREKARNGHHGGLVAFLNPYSYLILREQADVVRRFDAVCFDGIVLSSLMRLVGVRCKRTSFDSTSIAAEVFGDCVIRGRRVYVIGGSPGVPEQACAKFRDAFPGLKVVGCRHGYFTSATDREEVIRSIVALSPDVLVAGMGTPYQERFLADARDAGWKGTGYTCGGFLHQTAGAGLQYYPRWVDRLNLRFLYRMVDEPQLVRRYALDYPKFLYWFCVDLLRLATGFDRDGGTR